MDAGFWEQVITVRDAVSKELEKLRVAGAIGSSLDAEVDLYADGKPPRCCVFWRMNCASC